MIEANKDQPATPDNAATQSNQNMQDFVFVRELAEVYLLLDHISMSRDKRLQKTTTELKPADPDAKAFISDLCQIAWPPTGGEIKRADQAATLLLALDTLNNFAAPATGASIAFTTLVAGGGDEEGVSAGGPPLPVSGFESLPTRTSLASWAFPGLPRAAARFKRLSFWLVLGIAVWLVLTCGLSWDVAAGNAMLGQVNALKLDQQSIEKQIAAAEISKPATEGTAAGTTTITVLADPRPYCSRFAPGSLYEASGRAGVNRVDTQTERLDGSSGLPICDELRDNALAFSVASDNLQSWVRPWTCFGLCASSARAKAGDDADAARERASEAGAQTAAAVLNVLGGAVLPIFYGLLGAGAAVVRGLSARIRDSLLAPRDFTLSLVQLALGAVIGGCIGLFVTPAGSGPGTAPGLLGSVHLSASALCFIAGFGVEGVFVALETLMQRVFNIADSKKPTG